jgi:hypothetical protein
MPILTVSGSTASERAVSFAAGVSALMGAGVAFITLGGLRVKVAELDEAEAIRLLSGGKPASAKPTPVEVPGGPDDSGDEVEFSELPKPKAKRKTKSKAT